MDYNAILEIMSYVPRSAPETGGIGAAVLLGYIVGLIVVGTIWGLVTRHINQSKGYKGGFAWGFFLGLIGVIVVACKTDLRQQNIYNNPQNYIPPQQKSNADEIAKYKKLMDDGVITPAEFEAKKKDLLGIK